VARREGVGEGQGDQAPNVRGSNLEPRVIFIAFFS
jgi:hypothetical protein